MSVSRDTASSIPGTTSYIKLRSHVARSHSVATLSMRSRSVALLSAQYQCDIMIAIYRISLSLAGNELGIVRNRPKQPNQNKWRRILGSHLRFGPVQNEHLVVRTYDRWPLRTGQRSPRSTGPTSEKNTAGQWLMSRPECRFYAKFMAPYSYRQRQVARSTSKLDQVFYRQYLLGIIIV